MGGDLARGKENGHALPRQPPERIARADARTKSAKQSRAREFRLEKD